MSTPLENIREVGAYLPVRLGLEETPARRAPAPELCAVCWHPDHGSGTCLTVLTLRNVYGSPKMACYQCGPGAAEAGDQEGDDDDRA